MTAPKLPINKNSWLSTIVRWGAELRSHPVLTQVIPEWLAWDPQIASPGGVLTISNVDLRVARYCPVGKIIFFHLFVGFQTGGAGFPYVTVTPPIAGGRLSYSAPSFSSSVIDGGTLPGVATLEDFYIYVARYDLANWGLGAGRFIRCSGFYEID